MRNKTRFSIGAAVIISLGLALPSRGVAQTSGIEIPTLQWGDSKRPDGSTRHWDPRPLIDLGATLVSVAYRPLTNAEGKQWYRVGMTPPKLLQQTLHTTLPELEECHRHGIKVIGYADTIMFHPDMLITEGIESDDLYAVNRKGQRVTNSEWDKGGVGVSCINNPKWVQLQKEVTRVHARAGFDGLQFDVYPYAIEPGYQCTCHYCTEDWKRYSKKVLGAAAPMPGLSSGKLDYRQKVDRAFKTWRLQNFVDFVRTVEIDVRKMCPHFMILMNHAGGTPDFTYEAVHGALRYPTTELWHLQLGDDSTLYLYGSAEAANSPHMIGLINFSDQLKPFYRYRVALAEAYAAGGIFYAVARGDASSAAPISHAYCDFFRAHQDWYNGSEPAAEVALLYSWRDQAFLQGDPVAQAKVDFDPKRTEYQQAAALLARLGIPHDCIIVEKGLKRALGKYRAVVIPRLSLVTEEDAAALKNFVTAGGQALVIGDLGAVNEVHGDFVPRSPSLLAEWVEGRQGEQHVIRMGKGRIVPVPTATEPGAGKEKDGKMAVPLRPLSPKFSEACNELDLSHQLRLKSTGAIEVSIRSKANHRAIHLIRFGPTDDLEDRTVSVDYKLPARTEIESVSAWTPDYPGECAMDWERQNDRVIVKLKRLDTYALLGISLRDGGKETLVQKYQ